MTMAARSPEVNMGAVRQRLAAMFGGELPAFLRVGDIARFLGVHYNTAWRWIDEGALPSIRSIKSGRLVPIDDFLRYLGDQ